MGELIVLGAIFAGEFAYMISYAIKVLLEEEE